MVFGHEFADTAANRSALRMHVWRYPPYRYSSLGHERPFSPAGKISAHLQTADVHGADFCCTGGNAFSAVTPKV